MEFATNFCFLHKFGKTSSETDWVDFIFNGSHLSHSSLHPKILNRSNGMRKIVKVWWLPRATPNLDLTVSSKRPTIPAQNGQPSVCTNNNEIVFLSRFSAALWKKADNYCDLESPILELNLKNVQKQSLELNRLRVKHKTVKIEYTEWL